MPSSRIKIQIVPSRSGRTWSVRLNGWLVIRQTDQPLAEIASRMIAAGHKPHRAIVMTRSPDGPCRCASTLGAAAQAEATSLRFREPEWKPLGNGGH